MAEQRETPEPRLHSREWFAMKVQAAKDRIEAEWPGYMKATFYVASATLPTIPSNDRGATMTDHNEAMRLADELVAPIGTQTSYQTAHEAAALIRKQAERIAELEAEVQEQARCNGMGAERELALMAERDRQRAEVERQTKTDAEIIACNYPDGEENGPTVAAPDFDLICFARQLGIRDTARKATP